VHVDDDESDEGFRDFIAELFIANSISGPVTQKIYHKAATAKAEGVSDLARVGNPGKAWKNIYRDLMRRLMKVCTNPEPYWCLAPVVNKQTGANRLERKRCMNIQCCCLMRFCGGTFKRTQSKLQIGGPLLPPMCLPRHTNGVPHSRWIK
jgi:hypothetical protein